MVNLKEENRILKEKLKAYQDYYGNQIINLCLRCNVPLEPEDKVTVIYKRNGCSKTQGHLHKKCWDKII